MLLHQRPLTINVCLDPVNELARTSKLIKAVDLWRLNLRESSNAFQHGLVYVGKSKCGVILKLKHTAFQQHFNRQSVRVVNHTVHWVEHILLSLKSVAIAQWENKCISLSVLPMARIQFPTVAEYFKGSFPG